MSITLLLAPSNKIDVYSSRAPEPIGYFRRKVLDTVPAASLGFYDTHYQPSNDELEELGTYLIALNDPVESEKLISRLSSPQCASPSK